VYVPSVYTIYLNPADREQFTAYEAQMCSELEEYLVEHARREGYTTASRPVVTLETEEDLHVGMFGIAVEAGDEEELAAQPDAGPEQERPSGPEVPSVPVAAPLPPVAPGMPSAPPGSTMVYAAEPDPEPEPEPEPERTPARAEVVVLMWDGREFGVESPITVIGRSSECDIVLGDPNVSRRHAEVRRIGRGYSLVDLGSTNGTEVNGQRVTETSLMNGDVIGVGTTQITFERRIG
jgi:hypothetical protein